MMKDHIAGIAIKTILVILGHLQVTSNLFFRVENGALYLLTSNGARMEKKWDIFL